jgi:hypothetical protein
MRYSQLYSSCFLLKYKVTIRLIKLGYIKCQRMCLEIMDQPKRGCVSGRHQNCAPEKARQKFFAPKVFAPNLRQVGEMNQWVDLIKGFNHDCSSKTIFKNLTIVNDTSRVTNGTVHFKNVNNCLNTNVCTYFWWSKF